MAHLPNPQRESALNLHSAVRERLQSAPPVACSSPVAPSHAFHHHLARYDTNRHVGPLSVLGPMLTACGRHARPQTRLTSPASGSTGKYITLVPYREKPQESRTFSKTCLFYAYLLRAVVAGISTPCESFSSEELAELLTVASTTRVVPSRT